MEIKGFFVSAWLVVYKFFYEVLADQLKMVLERLLSSSHYAFIKKQCISYRILIAIKCVDSLTISGISGVLDKLDLEKVMII